MASAPDQLSDPILTGTSSQDLQALTAALNALRQTPEPTGRAYRRDGQPHALRSGRPPQRAFAHRVLVTVLHLRLSLPHDTLAQLFSCSRTTIRRAIAEIRPLLTENGTDIEPDPHPTTPLTDLLTKIKTTG